MQLPPIEKMDATLSTLPNCEWVRNIRSKLYWRYCTFVFRWLSLSSNCIEKITNLNGMSEYIHSLCFGDQSFRLFLDNNVPRKSKDSLSWSKPYQKPNWTGQWPLLLEATHALIMVLILSRKLWLILLNSCGYPTTSLRNWKASQCWENSRQVVKSLSGCDCVLLNPLQPFLVGVIHRQQQHKGLGRVW